MFNLISRFSRRIFQPSSFPLWPPWESDSSLFRHAPNLSSESQEIIHDFAVVLGTRFRAPAQNETIWTFANVHSVKIDFMIMQHDHAQIVSKQ